jgi:arylsulfatase A
VNFIRLSAIFASILSLLTTQVRSAPAPPNIVFIMADDLGFGHVGCYGQKKILTPNIDRLASEGIRFTQCYAGSHVCAPSRSVLMTGLHTGHTPVRANGGGRSLLAQDVTIAEVLKSAGYVTGGFGKWGLGTEESQGFPGRQGFDEWFGFYHQVHAHFFYPYYLWHNETKYPLPSNEGRKRGQYAHDEIHAKALEFIRNNKSSRFFAYLPYTLPHVELVVPPDSMKPYQGKWPETALPDPRPGYIGADEPLATYAGMVSRLDKHVGEALALLKELGIAENTVVFFTSDNGPQGDHWKRLTDFFEGKGSLRGYKGQFYEGGIRVPMIVRWPGRIKPGAVSDQVIAFWDVLPTLAEIAAAKTPKEIDGLSFLPTLTGQGTQKEHDFLYWEMPQRNRLEQAARMGKWKAVRHNVERPLELYDLKSDPNEATNVASKNPEIVATIKALFTSQHSAERPPQDAEPVSIKDYVR